MDRDDRNRLARFERIMGRLDEAEKDTMWRLRRDGWRFKSVEAAKAELAAIRREVREQSEAAARLAVLVQSRSGRKSA